VTDELTAMCGRRRAAEPAPPPDPADQLTSESQCGHDLCSYRLRVAPQLCAGSSGVSACANPVAVETRARIAELRWSLRHTSE
jgi:hypothetical protein